MNDPGELQRAVSILTTQHYTLQSSRSQVLSDLQGRASIFLTTVSGSLVALSLVGQSAKLGGAFVVFGAVVFPVLTIMGVLTYARGLELEAEDVLHGRGIARIRQFYVETTPAITPYLLHTTHDDLHGIVADMGIRSSPWQPLFSGPTMIGFVTGILAGSTFAFIAQALGVRPGVSAVIGCCAGLALIGALWWVSGRTWARILAEIHPRNPSPPDHDGA